jgi:guanidinoacetate N-methyltransferase
LTRKIRRTADYEFNLEIKNDTFIAPPRAAQRNWLLNRAVSELAGDLAALNGLARRFVPGMDAVQIEERSQSHLADEDIMEDWQIPLMQAMAAVVTENHSDMLEIGFGRGIASGFIQEGDVRSHTIIECNQSVIERFPTWAQNYAGKDIRIVPGRWQDVIDTLGAFDGIFFHTYPMNEEEYMEQVLGSVTYAEHFFPTAAAHLRPGGFFTYMTNEIDSLSRDHQRLLLRHFSSFSVRLCQDLPVPPDIRDTWWIDSMVIVQAVK